MNVLENVGLRPGDAGQARKQRRAGGPARCWSWCSCSQFADAQAVAALRRTAAAGGAGPRPGAEPKVLLARRAAVGARSEAAQGHADRAEAHPARDRHHLHLRHPRPGRGADHVGPDRGDVVGRVAAARRTRGTSTKRPRNRFVADFIGETNLLEVSVDAIRRRAARCCHLGGGHALTCDAVDGSTSAQECICRSVPSGLFLLRRNRPKATSLNGMIDREHLHRHRHHHHVAPGRRAEDHGPHPNSDRGNKRIFDPAQRPSSTWNDGAARLLVD